MMMLVTNYLIHVTLSICDRYVQVIFYIFQRVGVNSHGILKIPFFSAKPRNCSYAPEYDHSFQVWRQPKHEAGFRDSAHIFYPSLASSLRWPPPFYDKVERKSHTGLVESIESFEHFLFARGNVYRISEEQVAVSDEESIEWSNKKENDWQCHIGIGGNLSPSFLEADFGGGIRGSITGFSLSNCVRPVHFLCVQNAV